MGQEGTERRTFRLGSVYCLLAFSVFLASFYIPSPELRYVAC